MLSDNSGTIKMLQKFVFFTMLLCSHQHIAAYTPISKENIFADVLLTEILNRMDKDMDPASNNYFDLDLPELQKGVDLVSRSSKNSIPDDFEYRNMFGGASNPSIRDQEYLQHSSLWGHQYVSGGMGEVPNRYNPIVKTDASLPAYCNPPNPCPYGYSDSQGCISDFDNTAIFSREFQAAQECTCDSEHMFDCASQEGSASTNEMSSTMEKFLMHQFQNENGIDNSNAVVKKYYHNPSAIGNSGKNKKFYGFSSNQLNNNPYLQGEKLPIAAKKGDHIHI